MQAAPPDARPFMRRQRFLMKRHLMVCGSALRDYEFVNHISAIKTCQPAIRGTNDKRAPDGKCSGRCICGTFI